MTRSSSQELFHVDFRAERITCGRFRDYRARYTCNLKISYLLHTDWHVHGEGVAAERVREAGDCGVVCDGCAGRPGVQ